MSTSKRERLLAAIDAALVEGTITRRDLATRLGRGSGGGRPQSDSPRCACGRFTLTYAARWRPRHKAEACPGPLFGGHYPAFRRAP